MTTAEVLNKYKVERGISFAELGRRTGINPTMVSRFCKGQAKPSGEQLLQICFELGIKLEDFKDVAIRI